MKPQKLVGGGGGVQWSHGSGKPANKTFKIWKPTDGSCKSRNLVGRRNKSKKLVDRSWKSIGRSHRSGKSIGKSYKSERLVGRSWKPTDRAMEVGIWKVEAK
jgi:hypothetical protein